MTWIRTVAYESATGCLKKLYDRIKGPNNDVDNIMMLHSLRPHSMVAHMSIYKSALHHSSNTVPKWFLEVLGVWVSTLNDCLYCVDHHFSGLKRLLGDDSKATAIKVALDKKDITGVPVGNKEKLAMRYAEILTRTPAATNKELVDAMRSAGYSDGEILEINQVVSYFGYANRTVLGLGCSIDGDIIGLSPNNSADPDDWAHS